MSLINQMLRDLEQRNATSQIKPGRPVGMQVTAANHNSGGLFWMLPFLLLSILWIWQQTQQESRELAQAEPAFIAPKPVNIRETGLSPAPVEVDSAPSAYLDINKFLPRVPLASENTSPPPERKPKKPEFNAQRLKELPSVSVPPVKVISSPPLPVIKIKTPHEQAEYLYQQAQAGLPLAQARQTLLDALQFDAYYLPARSLLLQTLLKLQVPENELNGFVEASLKLFPGDPLFTKTRAHLYVQQKNYQAAVALLETIHAGSQQDSGYLSLLAASYQQLQDYPHAAGIYQQLTGIQPDKAENWLGLAIAQDRLNQKLQAQQAYQLALDKKSLNAQVVDYINQRLSVLN